MNPILYYILSGVLSALVLAGLAMESRVKLAVKGNLIAVGVMGLAILLTLFNEGIKEAVLNPVLWASIAVGGVIGILWARKVKMIEMPQTVGMLNGIGGLASALVGALELAKPESSVFSSVTAALALVIGGITFAGSLIAALKLARKIDSRPKKLPAHGLISALLLLAALAGIVLAGFGRSIPALIITSVSSLMFGTLFALRVGGADMPVAISLLNSLSGVAGAIAGMAIANVLLVAIGGIVGSSGLLLTEIMCRAMNRKLIDILLGKTVKIEKKEEKTGNEVKAAAGTTEAAAVEAEEKPEAAAEETAEAANETSESAGGAAEAAPEAAADAAEEAPFALRDARDVIIVPGYGMALSQAQQKVKELSDKLEKNGARVRFAIHPVAGRMPGHMNVLLAEADVDYDYLFQLDEINDDFKNCDAVVVVGASDVMNPAAREAEGTPIYGMPILNVDEAPHVFVCNFDLKPGYAGVENPLYKRDHGIRILLGDAKESLETLISEI